LGIYFKCGGLDVKRRNQPGCDGRNVEDKKDLSKESVLRRWE
jgi:hypothetical protein